MWFGNFAEGFEQRGWPNQHPRWVAGYIPNFSALLVCKLSRGSWDLENVFHALCRASHASSDTKAVFYKNKPWLFVCFTLYLSSGGLKSQRRQGEHETRHLMKSVFPISFEKCLRLTGCTQTHPLIPKPLGVLTVKNIYPGVTQFNIPTLNSPQHLSFRQTPFPIKHEDWEHWTLYSNHIIPPLLNCFPLETLS